MVNKRFTDKQLLRANNIDIADMLQKQGEKLNKVGRDYRWERYDSVLIKGNKWFRHSRQEGGGPIQFMQYFYDMNYVDAIKYLLDGEEGKEFIQSSNIAELKAEFIPPKLSKNMHRTFAYLIKTRKIDADIVQYFVNEKKIFETEEYHDIAFCGYDEDSKMKQMHLRSTIPGNRFFQDVDGSDKQYYFRHIGTNENVHVFEAPIDMLSYITLNKENWHESSYVCLGGVAIDALENILNANVNLKNVYLCVDNDEAGDKTVRRIGRELDEMNYNWERIIPKNKDWNEDLIYKKEQTENFDISM